MTEWGNEDLDVDFSRIYEIAKRDDLVEIEEFKPYKNTKRFTENLINDLCQSTEKYELRKTIQELERYIKESDRLEEFFYSDVSHYIFGLGVSEKKNLHDEVSPFLLRTIQGQRLQRIIDVNSTIRRQDMPSYYKVNGAIYINAASEITESLSFNDNPIPYIMSREYSVDIDTWDDLDEAERIMKIKML